MHLSMHNWMRAEPIDVTVRRLARYGYKSIEISGEPEIYDTKELRKLLGENGLACWGVVSLMFEGRDLIDAAESVRASSIQYLNGCITMVKELDGYEMTIVPSTVGKVAAMDTPEQEWAWAVEGLKEVYGHAQKAGVRLALEPLNRFETNFLNRADQAMLLAEEVGPDCGVCIDTFHLNIEEANLVEAIKSTKERLVDFHVADNNRMACGMGALDWPLIVRHAEGDRLRRRADRRVCRAAGPHAGQSLQECRRGGGAGVDARNSLQFIQDHGSGVLSEEFYSWLVEETANTLLPLHMKFDAGNRINIHHARPETQRVTARSLSGRKKIKVSLATVRASWGPCCHGDDEDEVYRELRQIVEEWLEFEKLDKAQAGPIGNRA